MSRIIIIGAGHNGLVCALYLARHGHSVTVYERYKAAGGCTVTEEFYPGFKYNTGAIDLEGLLNSGVIGDLELEKHGLNMLKPQHLVSAWVGDDSIHLHRDLDKTLAHITKKRGAAAATAWKEYAKMSNAVMGLLGTFQHVKSPGVGGLSSIMGNIGAMGEDNEAIIQAMLSPAVSNLDLFLPDPVLRGAAMAYATHPQLPPWVPGTGPLAFLLGSSHEGSGGRPVGGTGMFITALLNAAKEWRVEVKCNCGIKKMIVKGGRICGVVTDSGEKDEADVVISTIDIKRLVPMFDKDDLPQIMEKGSRRAHSGMFNVGEIKVDCALSAPPEFIGGDMEDCRGSLRFLMHHKDGYIENFRRIAGGELPDNPPIMMVAPSMEDPTQAPEGKCTLWMSSFVPAKFYGDRKWPDMNKVAAERIIDSFERFAPGTKKNILHCNITGPSDWEDRTGNPAGNPNHLDMTVDQMFSYRPVAGLGYYRTPVKGFYISGPSTHPGGGAHGMPGKLTASAVIDDLEGRPFKVAKPSLIGMAKSYFTIRKALR
jgi:phytoene dehydrogenase-like protein